MTILSSNQLSRIKQQAKKASKASANSHLMILDQEAQSRGYPNWAALNSAQSSASRIFPVFQRTPEEMQTSFRKVRNPPGLYRARDEENEVRKLIEPIHEKYANPLSALIYARDYIKCALQTKRWAVDGLSVAYSEMRLLLPYNIQRIEKNRFIIVGRDYKPVGMTEREWADYSLYANLHFTLGDAGVARIEDFEYLYTDGNTPWRSRKNAQSYLHRLEELIDFLTKNINSN